MDSSLARRSASVGDRRISYLFREGSPRLALIPGSHQDSRQWSEVANGLGESLGLVVVELPGHGQSVELPDEPSIERFALDVWKVLDASGFDNNIYVAGHSLGGMVALEMGRARPSGIKGIIAVEGWTNHHAAEDAFAGRMYDTLTPELLAKQDDYRSKATGHRTDEERRILSGLWRRWDGSAFLQSTSLPILELWGDRGRPKPALAQLHIPVRKNISVKWFENASHNLPLERPLEVARAIMEFIESVEIAGKA